MAHELEINRDGSASMFYVRERPWHGMGTRLDAPPTAAEAIAAAGLDWSVSLEPVYSARKPVFEDPKITWDRGTVYSEIDGVHAVMRSTDKRVLGIVGGRYEPVQNTEAFRFFDRLIQDGSGTYETAGSLKGGRLVWVLVKLQGSAEVAAGDRIDSYLFLSTAHDGSSSVSIKFTDVRIVCANTLTYASEGNGDKLSVKHTQGVHAALELISGLVDARQARFEASIDQYVQLAALDIDAEQLSTFVRVVLRDVDSTDVDAVRAQAEEKPARGEERITDIFHNDPACTLRSIRGSWWSALNAVTSYIDHDRGNDAQQRLYSSFMGQGAALKERALKTALSLSV